MGNNYEELIDYIRRIDLSQLKIEPLEPSFRIRLPPASNISDEALRQAQRFVEEVEAHSEAIGVKRIQSYEGLNVLTASRAKDIEQIIAKLIFRKSVNPGNLRGKVVDLGMGTGPGAYVLKQYGGDITGVDSARKGIETAIEEGILPQDKALVRDGFEYLRELPSESLNFIAAFMMHQGFPHQRLYQESQRVLKFGGQLLITGGLLELKPDLERTVGRYGQVENVVNYYEDGSILGNVAFTYTKQ